MFLLEKMTSNKFNRLFDKFPVLGMIHLAGIDPVGRALKESELFEKEDVDGIIVENYCGSTEDVRVTLRELSKLENKIIIGVNILPNEFESSFRLANEYGAKFIQLDYVAGHYTNGWLNPKVYNSIRKEFSDIVVLGGVWPKYYHPIPNSNLEEDLKEGMERADAIVVTGESTGKETPLDKIMRFREILGDYPLVVGAGVNRSNIEGQFRVSDGFIIGSYFKDGQVKNPIFQNRVREIMDAVRRLKK